MNTLTKKNLFTEDLMQYEPEKVVLTVKDIIGIGTSENADPYWQEAENDTLLALIKDAINQPMKNDRTVEYVYRKLCDGNKSLEVLCDIKKSVDLPENTFRSVIATLCNKLQMLKEV